MAMTREAQAQLYTPIYDKMMLDVFAEETQKHLKIFESIDDKSKEYKVHSISGFGEWEEAEEGVDGQWEDPSPGYAKTYTQVKYRKRFKVTFEAQDQDEYALAGKLGEAATLGRGGRAKVERLTAGILINGFGASGLSSDAQYLFDTDHPKNSEETGTEYDNLLSDPFSHDALEAAEAQISNNMYDPAGLPIEVGESALVVFPPALKGPVMRVLNERAGERPDTTERDINIYKGTYTPMKWRYLSAKEGGSDTAWYIVFPSLGFFKIVWSIRPHFTSWIDNAAEFYNFSGRMLMDADVDNWRGSFGSTGL